MRHAGARKTRRNRCIDSLESGEGELRCGPASCGDATRPLWVAVAVHQSSRGESCARAARAVALPSCGASREDEEEAGGCCVVRGLAFGVVRCEQRVHCIGSRAVVEGEAVDERG